MASALAGAWFLAATRRADAWYDGDRATWLALADGVADHLLARGGDAGIATGSARFDGEWDLVTCQMGVIGLAQVALRYPDTERRTRPARDACLAWLVTPAARQFGTDAWGEDGLADPRPGTHAYLGYVHLALAVDALARPGPSPHAATLDRLHRALTASLRVPVAAFQTYPGETYPPDLAVVAASVAVHARARHQPVPAALSAWVPRYEAAAVDPDTGWLHQRLDPATGAGAGPRGSGTAFAAAWLAWVDPALSARLYRAHRALGLRAVAGLGGMREYPPGVRGVGDIDSGPVLLGIGASPTGFALAGARAHRDRAAFRALYRTAHLFGLPLPGGRWFATGGGIGNAVMLAMLTAPRATYGRAESSGSTSVP